MLNAHQNEDRLLFATDTPELGQTLTCYRHTSDVSVCLARNAYIHGKVRSFPNRDLTLTFLMGHQYWVTDDLDLARGQGQL